MRKLLLSAAFMVASFTSIAQVGIGTTTPDASAALELESTTKGFLLPRMTLAQIKAIVTPAEGLMVYCLDGTTKGVLVNNGVEFISIIDGESIRKAAVAAIVAAADNPAAGGTPSLADLTAVGITSLTAAQTVYEEAIADAATAPTTGAELQAIIDAANTELAAVAAIVAAADNPAADGTPSLDDLAAVGITSLTEYQTVYEEAIADAAPAPTRLAELQVIINLANYKRDTTTEIVDLTGPGGGVWMDRNLGATQVAASITDAASYGDLYQWGRDSDGHESRTSSTTATTVTTAAAGHGDFITAGSGTSNNWTDFADEDTLWQSNVKNPCPLGYRMPTEIELQNEITAFSSSDSAGAFSALKLPAAGRRSYSNGTLGDVGSFGRYWSSTVSSAEARTMYFSSSNAGIVNRERALGYSLRCIKD
jgi:uncharacterized protein (TIGR02145 family)